MSAETLAIAVVPSDAVPSTRRTGARRERRHLRVVHDGPRSHPLVFLLLYLVIGVAAVIGAVTLNALAAQDSVLLSQTDRQLVDAQRDYGLLTAEVATLEDPDRIRQLAEQMGMAPTPQRFLVPSQSLPLDHVEAATRDPLKPILTAQR